MGSLSAPPFGRDLWPRRRVQRLRAALTVVLAGFTAVVALLAANGSLAAADGAVTPDTALAGPARVVERADPSLTVRTDAAEAVVRVTGRSCEGHGGGSGWYLRDGRLVTAAHVVDGSAALLAQGPDGAVSGAVERWSAPGGDLAVATVDRMVARALPLGGTVTAGDTVTVAGVARDGRVHTLAGSIVATAEAADYGLDGTDLIVVDAEVEPGMSGGPAVDAEGRVIGVVRAVERSSGVTLITPVAELWSVLDVGAGPGAAPSC